MSNNRRVQIYQRQKLIQNHDVQILRNQHSNTENFSLEPILSHLNQYLSVFSVLDCIVASLVSWIALLHPLVNPAPSAIYII